MADIWDNIPDVKTKDAWDSIPDAPKAKAQDIWDSVPDVQKPTKTGDSYTDYVMGDGIIPSIARGLTTAANRTRSYINATQEIPNMVEDKIDSFLGKPKREHKPYFDKAQIASELTRLETKKEEVSQRNITPKRKAEIEKLNKAVMEAHGLDVVKPLAHKVVDMATTPSEWTLQGIVENLTPTDAVNLAGAGLGGAMAAPVKSTIAKSLFGAAGGAIEGGGANGLAEYAVARNRGFTHEEALQHATPAAIIGSVIGAPIGTVTGAGKSILADIQKARSVEDIKVNDAIGGNKNFTDIVAEQMSQQEAPQADIAFTRQTPLDDAPTQQAVPPQAVNNVINDIPTQPITPREQFIQSVTKARGEEEALMNINLIDAKAKTEGITTDDWLTKNGLKVEQHTTDGAEFAGKGDSLNQSLKSDKFFATHRTNINNLNKMADSGVLPAPSFALSKNAKATEQFGDIIIVPKEKHIDPNKGAHVFGGDAWTPRINFNPNEEMDVINLKAPVFDRMPKLKQIAKDSGTPEEFRNQVLNDERTMRQFEDWANKTNRDAYDLVDLSSSQIFKKESPSIDLKIKEIKKLIKDNDGDMRGLEDAWTPEYIYKYAKYHTMGEIKQRIGELKTFKNKDRFYEEAQKAMKNDTQPPADYMEAKRLDKVQLDDVSRIVVPHNQYDEVVAMMKDKGIDVPIVKMRKGETENSAIRRSSDGASDVMFQKLPSETVNALVQFGAKSKEEINTIIRLFKTADVSSIPHELAHVFRRNLSPQELRSAEKAFGVQDGHWTVVNEEAFAEGFVKWLSEGKAPTTELASTFKQFQSWLKDLWLTLIKSKEQGFALTKEHKEFYKAMMGDKEAAKKLFHPKVANARAQRIAMAAEVPVGGSEDMAKQAVKNEFKKQPDSQYKNMSKDDIKALEEEHTRALYEEADTLFQTTPQAGNKKLRQAIQEKADEITTTFQDYWKPVERLIQNGTIKIKNNGDDFNQARILMAGRVGTRIERVRDVQNELVKSIIKSADDMGIDVKQYRDDLNAFMVAQHAPERNHSLNDGAAGITTEQATASLEALKKTDPKRYVEYTKLAKRVRELNEQTLDVLLDGQVISKELHETLRGKYTMHVPLQRVMPDDLAVRDGITGGKGLSVKSSGIQRAKGSDLEVSDILGNVSANLQEAIIRAEKNKVGLSLLKAVSSEENKGIATVRKIKTLGKGWGENGQGIRENITDDMIVLRVNGEAVIIEPKDPVLAQVYNKLNVDDMSGAIKYLAPVTRFMAAMATRFNPEFALSNLVRDMQESMIYNATRMSAKDTLKAGGYEAAALNGVRKYIMNGDRTSEWAKYYDEMQMSGGTTGGMALSTRKAIHADVEEMFSIAKKIDYSAPVDATVTAGRKAIEKMFSVVDGYNQIFEDATRLSAYRTAREAGMSADQAAVIAKETTIDFNRRGNVTPWLNSLYMFSNASIQGSWKMIRAMKDPKIAAITVGIVGGTSMALDAMNDAMSEDWREKVPEFERSTNFVIVLGEKEDGNLRYAKIPIGWGIKPIKTMFDVGRDIYVDKMSGNPFEKIVTSVINSYNPIGGNNFSSMITPTPFDAAMEISVNENFKGSMIHPDFNEMLQPHERYWQHTGESATGKAYITLVDGMEEVGIDLTTDDVKHIISTIGGGPLRFTEGTINALSELSNGDDISPRNRLFMRRFYTESDLERMKKPIAGKRAAEIAEKYEDLPFVEKQKAIGEELMQIEDQNMRTAIYKKLHYGGVLKPSKKEAIRLMGADE